MNDPRPTVGVVGAGQLARMCAQAAIALDVELRVLAARPDDSAAIVVPLAEIGDPADPATLQRFAACCDVLTLDHELVDREALTALAAAGRVVRPSADALRFAQDKAFQRRAFRHAGLPVPAFIVTDRVDAARAFAEDHDWPLVCKRPRGGYDGRGVWHVADPTALTAAWGDASAGGSPVLVEQGVNLEREIAVLIARRPDGSHAAAPVIETIQRDGMLRELVVPAQVPTAVERQARDLAVRVADLVDVVGVCAIELFWTGTQVLINEIATRPHNSGHWTIDGASTSQFENHLRAVLDLPLGSMRATQPAVCSVNVVGGHDGVPPRTRLPDALAIPDVHVHLYGKSTRPGRKLGHVTATADDVATARHRARAAAAVLAGSD